MDSVSKVNIYGLPVWNVSVDEICALIKDWAIKGEGRWIATLNLDYIGRIQRDPEFKELISHANVFTADGMPVLWACRQLNPDFKSAQRTTGADLTPKLIKDIDPSMVGIIGGVDPKLAIKTLGKNPDDYFIFDGKVELNEEWAKSLIPQLESRRVVFVALGCPKQEKMIDLLRKHLPNHVFVAVGGSFEMIAGIVRRAPVWMRKSGLEWFYRLAREPKRLWKRYLLEYPPGAFSLYRSIKAERRTISSKLPPA